MALGFGRYRPYPKRYGGGRSTLEDEHLAMLDALAKGWDVAEPSAVFWEAYAHAQVLSTMWALNERLRNQALPLRMLENLTVWEEATGMRPAPTSSDAQRRAALAAKLRGFGGNLIADIQDTCEAEFGINYVEVRFATDEIVYWPGGPSLPGVASAPGPPGFEWSTNRVRLAVEVTKTNLTDTQYRDQQRSLYTKLEAMMPAWMTCVIGVGTEFVVNVGIVGQTFI